MEVLLIRVVPPKSFGPFGTGGLFLLHRKLRSLCNKKPSGQDAHTAMRNFTAKRCCGGAQSGTRPSKIEGMGELKWACPLCSVIGKTLSR